MTAAEPGGPRIMLAAICCQKGTGWPTSPPHEGSDEESWRAGHSWWESHGLADARRHATRTVARVALTTQAGSTADEDFPGLAALVAPGGEVVARLPDWRAGTLVAGLDRRSGGARCHGRTG